MTETIHFYRSIAFIILGIILFPSLSSAFCFEEAGRLYGLNPRLLWSIAKVESDFNPTAINRREKDFDYGVMQINSWWYRRLGKKRWMALADPCYNVKTGAWILAQSIREHGGLWQGVGYYHAQSQVHRDRYVKKVYDLLLSLERRQ
jgi:soluble lytic murein transglycosylase-like protein